MSAGFRNFASDPIFVCMKRFIVILLLVVAVVEAPAREVFPLNEGWRFFFKSEATGDQARHVTLPHSWNTDPLAETMLLETTGNYLNNVYIPSEWASKRIFVRFYGAQSVADLFVNGCHAGSHRGGAAAFTFEVTDFLKCGADNALLMVVSNAARNDVLPTSTDMNLYGGLYREAELIVAERTTVSPLYLGTEGVLVRPSFVDATKVEGEIEVHLTSRGESSTMLGVEIVAPDGTCVFSRRQRVKVEDKPLRLPFSIGQPRLWSPSSPSLYRVEVCVGELNRDCVEVRTGFRSVVAASAGGLLVNGVLTPVRGVTLYHDNALSGGTLTDEDYAADLYEIRTLGANALRSAVMPHAPGLYDRCDEQGVLVWVDTPFHYSSFLGDVAYYATPEFEQNGLDQLREIVAQNINHPSVVMWGIFSRIQTRGDDAVPYIRRLHEAARGLDPSRPTVACSDQNGDINFITDLIVWRQNVGWEKGSPNDLTLWRKQLQKSWSHLRSGVEYGGSGFIGHRSYTSREEPCANWQPEERQTLFHEEYARNLESDSLFWGVWIDNMFDYGSARRPYGINGKGLVTLDRRNRKDVWYLYRALWNREEPILHITGKHLQLRDAARQSFRIYSSAGEPLLLVGSDTVAVTRYAACQYRSDTVRLAGRVEVKALAGDLRDSVTILVGNVLRPKYSRAPLRTAGPQRTN